MKDKKIFKAKKQNPNEETGSSTSNEASYQELLGHMAGDDGVFLIDFANDTRKTIHDRVHGTDEFSDSKGYAENFGNYIDKFVAETDRSMLREVSSFEYMREHLKAEKEFTVRYREIDNGELRWFEMRTVKVSETSVLQSFKDVTEAAGIEQVQKALSDDYFAVYYVDLDNDLIRVVKRSYAFRPDSGINTRRYSDIIRLYTSGLSEKDRKAWKKLETAEDVKRFLANQDKREFLFESAYREDKLTRVTWYVLESADGEAKSVCMAFSELDQEEADRERLNQKIAEQKEQLQDADVRNRVLYDVSDAIKWSYEISADDRILSYTFADNAPELVKSDGFEGNPMAWADNVHPDDRDAAIAAFEAAYHDHSGETNYDSTYRIMGNDGKYVWLKVAGRMVRREDGSGEMFGVSLDITDQMEEQQKNLLGAVPISPDILSKEGIGMWAFELDEGQPPRMYGDAAMLKLVGLDRQVPPNEMYHAWYDHIDEGSYGLVNDAVEKMMSGEHAEVQYPWHHPDGYTMMVRCGGVRNPEYTKGIRVEGTHQDVTEVLHFDDAEVERLKNTEIQLQHEQLRSEVLNYMINNEEDPIELLKNYAERLRVLIGCDQVIYRDLEETRIMVNSPAIEETWSVPIEYCEQCEHFDAHHPMYDGGYTEMDNCQEGWQGIPVYHDCPIKSSLTRIVYLDGEVAGYLAIHYVQDYHHFTDVERKTVEEFTRILSISLSRFTARQENRQLKLLQEYQKELQVNNEIISGLASEYLALYYVNMKEKYFKIYSVDGKLEDTKKLLNTGTDAFELIRKFGQSEAVHPDDRAIFADMTEENIKKRLEGVKRFSVRFRRDYGQGYLWSVMDVVKYEPADEEANSIAIGFAERDKEISAEREHQRQLQEAYDKLNEAYHRIEQMHNSVKASFWSYDINADGEVAAAHYDSYADSIVSADRSDPMDWLKAIHPDDRERALSEFTAAINDRSGNTPYDITYRMLFKDGETKLIKASGKMNPHEDGTAELFGINVNITEQIENEREHQRQLQEAYDQIAEANASNEMVLSFVNGLKWSYFINENDEVFAAKYGDNVAQLYDADHPGSPMDWVDLVHPEDRDRVLATFMEVVHDHSGSAKVDTTYRVLGTDGNYHWNKITGRVLPHEDGTREIFGVGIDVSEQMEKERDRQQQLEEQLALSDGLAREYHTVWLVDGFGEHKLHLFRSTGKKTVQRAVQRGLDEPTYDGTMVKYVMDSVHEDDRARVLEASKFETVVRETPDVGTYVVSYKRYCDDEGNIDYHQMCFAKAVSEDGTVNYILAFRDADKMLREQIDQQKQLAEALSMAESANRAKTTFLNNMSHDIRTPMNAIIGYTGLAASHIDHKDQVQDYLGKIAQSSDHLLSLINDVLDMSRIESGKMNLDEKPENLSDIIHTLRDIVQADIHSKQLDFFVDAVDVNDEDVICDKLRLNQVLLNILSNSIKYTAAGGTVTMRVTEKTVKRSGYGSYEFRIKDNGMGMDQEFLDTIYDPFTRVKSSTVSGIQGTGLGMAITKNIVEMMGGTIQIESEPGKGTEVTINFDFKLQSAPKAPEEIPELKGVRALVADDDSNTCLSICTMVEDIGMRAEWCTSGKEAVIRADAAYQKGDSFKVFIIDWIMPDMNGIETTRRIRKVIGNDTPIIILTAYDWSDIEDEAREAGVTAFVSKPMFPSDLHRVLNRCLGKTEEPAEEKTVNYDFAGKKILLVEDNELNREIATEILEEDGFIIDTAEDGDIAVEKMKNAKSGDYDLILMDIQMPRMDGYEATRQIRALPPEGEHIPIIAMTANAFEEDRKLALEAGMDEHVAKPIDINKLKETLARFL